MEIKSIFTIYQICRLASGVRITPWQMTFKVPFSILHNFKWGFEHRMRSEAKRDNLRMEFHLVVLKVLSQTTTAWDHVVFHWQRRNWSRLSRSPAESPHVCFCRMARFKSCCVPRSPRSKIYLNRIVAAWRIVINSWQQLHQSPKQILSETNKDNTDIISIQSQIWQENLKSPYHVSWDWSDWV